MRHARASRRAGLGCSARARERQAGRNGGGQDEATHGDHEPAADKARAREREESARRTWSRVMSRRVPPESTPGSPNSFGPRVKSNCSEPTNFDFSITRPVGGEPSGSPQPAHERALERKACVLQKRSPLKQLERGRLERCGLLFATPMCRFALRARPRASHSSPSLLLRARVGGRAAWTGPRHARPSRRALARLRRNPRLSKFRADKSDRERLRWVPRKRASPARAARARAITVELKGGVSVSRSLPLSRSWIRAAGPRAGATTWRGPTSRA